MTCTNEVTLRELVQAVAAVKAMPDLPTVGVVTHLLGQLDYAQETIRISKETGVNAAHGALRAEIGDLAEAEVASRLVASGLEVVHQNTKPSEKGIDLVLIDPNTGELSVLEVKSTLDPEKVKPTLSNTKDGRQGGDRWVRARLAAAGLDPDSRVSVSVVHVNLANGTMQTFSVDEHGGSLAATGGPVGLEDAP